jgi:hypothetical protein
MPGAMTAINFRIVFAGYCRCKLRPLADDAPEDFMHRALNSSRPWAERPESGRYVTPGVGILATIGLLLSKSLAELILLSVRRHAYDPVYFGPRC